MGKVVDITGNKYGRLTVLSYEGLKRTNDKGHLCAYWRCKCECGNEITVLGTSLRSGNTLSCGCLQSDIIKTRNAMFAKHGAKRNGMRDRLYSIWLSMKSRCNGVNRNAYKYYCGREIKVCKEWDHDFIAFREWAINNGYRDGLSIDRINNDKGYSPNNCRWATAKEQANNRRNNILIEYSGKKQSVGDWARDTGLSYRTINARIKAGWEVNKALEYPSKRSKNKSLHAEQTP